MFNSSSLADWLSVSDWKKTYECKLGDYNAVSLKNKLKSFIQLMDLLSYE